MAPVHLHRLQFRFQNHQIFPSAAPQHLSTHSPTPQIRHSPSPDQRVMMSTLAGGRSSSLIATGLAIVTSTLHKHMHITMLTRFGCISLAEIPVGISSSSQQHKNRLHSQRCKPDSSSLSPTSSSSSYKPSRRMSFGFGCIVKWAHVI